MANQWLDLIGTSLSKLRLGFLGVNLKSSSGVFEVKNTADNAFADARAAILRLVGDDVIFNEQATSTGASWKFTVSRPSSGMTHDLQVIMPSGDPAVGQALTVASFASNIITLQYTTIAAGTDKLVCDTTSLVFGSSSPLAMFTLPQNARVLEVRIIIITPFDGTATVTVGVSGTATKFGVATAWDLSQPAKTTMKYTPGEIADSGGTEAIIATYSAGGATVGSALIEVDYVIPS
jgi:hypothetical protein